MNRPGVNLFWILVLFTPSLTYALSSDREQPIHIRAANVEINEKTGVSVYTGNVSVTQGSMELTADKLVVHSKNGEMRRMEGEGKPATFRQQPDGAEHEVRGEAQRIEYDADSEKAHLIGQGHVWRGKDEFSGERIIFDTRESIVQATSGDDDRVHAIIQPRKGNENNSQ